MPVRIEQLNHRPTFIHMSRYFMKHNTFSDFKQWPTLGIYRLLIFLRRS